MRLVLLLIFISFKLYSQVNVVLSSTIACNQNFSTVTFTISTGTPPYSFTVQTPSCSSNYTASSSNSNPTFTLPCAGVYTFSIKDATNAIIGNINHTVTQNTEINLGDDGITTIADTICLGDVVLLNLVDISPTYTLTNYNWSNGATGYSTLVSPTITTTYSIIALYTSVYSKTCTAICYEPIAVKSCFLGIGINTNNIANFTKLFPNPFDNQITLNTSSNDLKKLVITNTLGQIVYTIEFYQNYTTLDLQQLPSGAYVSNLYLNNQFNFRTKLIKK